MIFYILDDLKNLFVYSFQIIGVGAILFSFSPIVFFLAAFMGILGGYLSAKSGKLMEKFVVDLMHINIRYNYYLGLLVDDKYQKEFRLYDLREVISQKLEVFMGITKDRFAQVYDEDAKISMGKFFLLTIMRILLYSYAALRIVGIGGEVISLGSFSIILTANEQFSLGVTAFLDNILELIRHIRYFEPLFQFYELEEYKDNGSKILTAPIETLEFENVSFSYPKTEKLILKDVSFKLNKGETVALVGRNNSGKSTIVKLIAGLFQPDKGRILWNGVDIRELERNSYLKELTYVFQDFELFPFRIWENISSLTSEESIPEDIKLKVDSIIKRVNLEEVINSLPQGLETYLNKNIHNEATELSGGERQKMAIGRAIYKDSSLEILDEPTAALDPLAESEIYDKFNDLVKGRTALFISHRMSASKFCDRIMVLDEGVITG
ncbi:MAG: ATP-binding cassette domain-containing protein, partial [Gallicola sp.]|nr:ATP-binding cassette domain-containing protein [Gallicola sp.]